MKIGVYPGTFDPITKGHLDIIRRASALVDEVIVGVLNNLEKTPAFSVQERVELIEESVKEFANVRVESFSGLLVDFAHRNNAKIIIRGLRTISDMEYETQLALINRKLDRDIESVFLMTSNKYSFLSSSIVRQLASLGGDIGGLVPDVVKDRIVQKLYRKND